MRLAREIARPACIWEYFKFSSKVDNHNQLRQYELALEKNWVPKSQQSGMLAAHLDNIRWYYRGRHGSHMQTALEPQPHEQPRSSDHQGLCQVRHRVCRT